MSRLEKCWILCIKFVEELSSLNCTHPALNTLLIFLLTQISIQVIPSTSVPTLNKDMCKYQVAAIKFGGQHCCLINDTGQVFSSGNNVEGQLGCGNTKPRDVLTACKFFEGARVSVSLILFFFDDKNYCIQQPGNSFVPEKCLLNLKVKKCTKLLKWSRL